MTLPITDRQRLILEYIADRIREEEYPPTIQEIGTHFGIASTNGVYDHLTALEKKGYIERSSKARSIRLTQKAMAKLVRSPENTLPLLGQVAAGIPLLAEENIEDYITVAPQIAARDAFCLRIKGDSMIDAGIFENDIILVDRSRRPNRGDIVVALVEDEATVKSFYQQHNRIELRPANALMESLRYPADKVSIQGVVIGLQRTLS